MTTAGRRALTDGDFDLGVQLLNPPLTRTSSTPGPFRRTSGAT